VGKKRQQQQRTNNSRQETGSFAELGLSDTMLQAVEKARYTEPTPVQAGLIPEALTGKDVMGQARTGTGKTAAFVIPILERISHKKKASAPEAIILTPTRELAVQVREEFIKLAEGSKVRCVALYGGKPIRGQIDKLKRGVDVVVGTPGRILDHIGRRTLQLDRIHIAVLDEADRMLDIGFRPDIEKILRACPKERQTLLLSATVPPPVQRLAQRYMQDPLSLDYSQTDIASETIEQFYFTVEASRKFDLLARLLEREQPKQAIVFCRTKIGTQKVYKRLSRRRKGVDCIHGDLNQPARDRAMKNFRAGEINVLVATDVVGRGIDVTGISHIINYDVPQFSDDYIHRVGRTGRMGREGVAYTFVTPEEGNELTRIEIRINRLLKRDELPGFQAITPVASEPESGTAQPQPDGEQEPEETKKSSDVPDIGKRKRSKRYRRAL